jgi:hypothetical protein
MQESLETGETKFGFLNNEREEGEEIYHQNRCYELEKFRHKYSIQEAAASGGKETPEPFQVLVELTAHISQQEETSHNDPAPVTHGLPLTGYDRRGTGTSDKFVSYLVTLHRYKRGRVWGMRPG